MTDINCSVRCKHECNGKCTLSHIITSSGSIGYNSNCAYYIPRAAGEVSPKDTRF